MGAVQLNIRLDEDLKTAGDAVLADYGVSSTEAIRSLWAYMAKSRTLPDFIAPEKNTYDLLSETAEEGAGLVVQMAEKLGLHIGDLPSMSYEELREAAYEEWLLEKGEDNV